MAKYSLYGELRAKPVKEAEVEVFLKQGTPMAQTETGTANWYGFKEDKPGYSGFSIPSMMKLDVMLISGPDRTTLMVSRTSISLSRP